LFTLQDNGAATIGGSPNTQSSLSLTRLKGYSNYYDASNRYGDYGKLIFNADSSWTSGARRWLITNAVNNTTFAIIRSVDSTTDPSLGNAGSVTSGTVDFQISNAGAATFSSTITAGNSTFTNGTGLSQVTIGQLGTGYSALKLAIDSTKYSFLLGAQYNVDNGFEITPSTAVGGSTFSTPVFKILNTGAATFSSSVDARGDVTIGARTADTDSTLTFANGGDNQVRIIAQDFATDGRLGFWLNQSGVGFVERMVIKRDTGNVLIGTTTDAGNKLDVVNTPTFSSNGNSTILSTTNLSVASGATFNSGGTWAASRQNNLVTWNGSISTTLSNGAVMAGQVSINQHSFAAAGYTITVNQTSAPAIRAIAGLQVLQQTSGSYSGTISHGASLFVQGIYPTPSSAASTFTNYYALLINPSDEWGSVTLTNRWGIYQAGASDVNYLAAKLQVGSTTAVSGSYKVEVTGLLYASSGLKTGDPTGDTAQTWKLGTAYSGTVTHTHYVNVEVNGVIYALLASNAV
jgi:hypothetical protein